MAKMVPANQEDFLYLNAQNQAIIQHLVSQSPEQKITISLDDMDKAYFALKPKALIRTLVDKDTITIDIHVPEVDYPYPNTTWVQIPDPPTLQELLETYDLVPHG